MSTFDWKLASAELAAARGNNETGEIRRIVRTMLEAQSSPKVFAAAKRALDSVPSATLPAARLLILRSFTADALVAPLVGWSLARGLRLDVELAPYDQFEQVLLLEAGTIDGQPDAVLFLARLGDLAPKFSSEFATLSADQVATQQESVEARIDGWLTAARRKWPRAKLLVGGFMTPALSAFGIAESMVGPGRGHRTAVGELNQRLAVICASHADVVFVDIDHALSRLGHDRALDAKMHAIAQQPYSSAGLGTLAAWLSRVLSACFTPRKKCIVLDCDNTLWGGIIGEDGLDGIALGPEYPGSSFLEFQQALLNLTKRGVILALASKNNEADVLEVLDKHPHQVLRREHIAAHAISWNDKASGIVELAQTINIGVDSMVFIDDSDYECALVREHLPTVEVRQTPNNPLELCDFLDRIDSLDAVRVSADDRNRTTMYRAQAERSQAQKDAPTLDEFLQSLELKLSIAPAASAAEIARIAQLCQRTNQLNVTTRRHSVADVEAFVDRSDADVFAVRLTDRFGDYGISGVLITIATETEIAVESLLLSCRVIGRGVETALGTFVDALARDRSVSSVTSSFVATTKNALVADLFDRLGYERLTGSNARSAETVRYRRAVPETPVDYPSWFTLGVSLR